MRFYTDAELLKKVSQSVADRGLRQTARDLGFSAGFIGDVIKGKRDMSKRLALALGYDEIVVPVKPQRKWKRVVNHE